MKPFKNYVLFTTLTVLMLLWLPVTCMANGLNHTEGPETNSQEEAAQLFKEGREAFEMGRTSDAILYFDKAVQKDAQYAIAWLYKAITAETDAEQKTSISKAVRFRNNATEGERILIDIELSYADNNSEKRFQLAKQLAELHPESARALLVLAGEYQSQGKISKFRDLAGEAIRVEPESPLGYRALAASYLLNEPTDFSLAERYMRKFVELRPNEALAHIAMGDVYRAALSLGKAKTAYSKAIDIEPQSAVALSKRGYINTYMGMFEESRTDFKKASALNGNMQDYTKPNFNMGLYLFPGNGKVVVTDDKLTSNEQNNTHKFLLKGLSDNCYFCCTFISMFHGLVASPEQLLDAHQSLRHELDMESRVPEKTTIEANISFMRGFRAIQEENYVEAKLIIEDYARTISPEMKPQKNEAHNFLAGLIHVRQGKYNKALASFKKSDTGNIFVKYNMGLVYDKLGRYEEAQRVFKEVVDFNFANASETQMAKTANSWLKSYEDALMAGK